MTEVEKAIEYFRYLANGVPKRNLLFGKHKDYENKMRFLAMQALQEKAERGKGCEYCNGKVLHTEKYEGLCDVEVMVTDDILEVNTFNHKTQYTEDVVFNFDIKHCPMCGRKLVQE